MGPRQDSDTEVYAALARSRTVFYTPSTTSTLRQLNDELTLLAGRVEVDAGAAAPVFGERNSTEPVISLATS